MNALIIGSDKKPLLRYIPERDFLVIDDGPIIDQLDTSRARVFDISSDSFDPLKDMDYRRAREFIGVLDAVFPEGEHTLTKARTRFQILEALLARPKKLSGLIKDTKETEHAYQTIETLLLSPVLKRVLDQPANFSLDGTIVARLNRAELGDFDAFVIGNLLISQFAGTLIVPDFGFYASPFHVGLIRQQRLIAGINSFEEVPGLRHHLLLIETKIGRRCTADDAETLAVYAGHVRGTEGFNVYRDECIR